MQIPEPKQGYKIVKTLFEKYEEIPEDWDYVKLQKVTHQNEKHSIKMGPFGSSLKINELQDEGEIKTIWIENIIDNEFSWNTRKYISTQKYQELEAFTVKPGDVLITMMGTLGRIAVVPDDIGTAIISSHLLKISVDQRKILPIYLYYFLLSNFIKKQILRESRGIVMGGLNTSIIKSLLIYLPSVKEQQKITSVLSNVDSLILTIQKSIEQTQRLKKGLMKNLFTKGISHTKFKKIDFKYNPYRLVTIPEDWDYVKLGSTGDFINGLNKDKEDYGHGCLHVNIDNIFENLEIDLDNLGRVNATDKEIERYRLEKNDILLLRSSVKLEGVGYPALFPGSKEPVVFSGFIIRFRPNPKIWNPTFLTHLLRTDFIRWNVKAWATVSANVNINQESCQAIPLPCPSVKEQDQITSIITNLDSKIRWLTESKTNAAKLKKGLMQKLLTGQIRMKV